MADLLVRAQFHQETHDLVVRYDDHTLIGHLADRLERLFDRAGDVPRTIRRESRTSAWFSRDDQIVACDLRSGDIISLGIDNGLRGAESGATFATVRVVGGPDTGASFELGFGDSRIGRSRRCEICLTDSQTSRHHATIRVSDVVEIADAASTNGVLLDDEPIVGTARVRPGQRVAVGDTVLMVDPTDGQQMVARPTNNRLEFNRPPRIHRPYEGREIEITSPPDPPRRQRLPMITAIVPVFMGLGMWALTGSARFALFLLFSPIMMVGSTFEARRSGRHEYKAAREEWEELSFEEFTALDDEQRTEVANRTTSSPGPTELIEYSADLSDRIWERKPTDPDFLHLRVGLSPQNSRTRPALSRSGGSREERRELEERLDTYRNLPPVPATVDARFDSPVGLAGHPDRTLPVLRSAVAQAASLHSPAELVIGCLLPEDEAEEWDWLKWLPHCRSSYSPIGSPLAVGADQALEVVASLSELINERRKEVDRDRTIFTPQIMMVISDRVPLERNRFASIRDHGAQCGVSVLWVAEDVRMLPNACRTVIDIEPGASTVGLRWIESAETLGGIPHEGMSLEACEIVGRSLTSLVDTSVPVAEDASLPPSVSVIDLLGGLEIIEGTSAILERWSESEASRQLRGPIGMSADGILNIDLRVDGPHGLVGGTTGAGKSEFIQSLLLGLAANHSPDRINFLLVDYKGGAAFTECIRLPHTVGLITDLTPALVNRALISLRAELHRREVILNSASAKDLPEMERRRDPTTPPNLLIVVDEFAALVSDVPDFIDGVVDIAMRGRSLGMHLLLATQRPAGVITQNIRANTNLRVALRMASDDESKDVVDSPIAGQIDRAHPGRGVIRRGPTDLAAFQSGYAGATTREAESGVLEIGPAELGRSQAWHPSPPRITNDDTPPDLTRLVSVLRRASRDRQLAAPRRPWLEPLPTEVDLFDLPRPETDGSIPFGLLDNPSRQTRAVATFEPDRDGSMLVYGTGRAGKTVFLRTMAAAFGLSKDRNPVEVHALDFGGRGLAMIEPLPHVGTVVDADDQDLMIRLLKVIRFTIEDRAAKFAKLRASTLTEYRSRSGDNLARMIVLIDSYDNFVSTHERTNRGTWTDLVPRLVADGREVGVHFIATGIRRASFPTSLTSSVQSRLVLRMASDDDWAAVGVNPREVDEDLAPGRSRYGNFDVQVAIAGGSSVSVDEDTAMQKLAIGLDRAGVRKATPVRLLPDLVAVADMPQEPVHGELPWLLTEDFTAIGPTFSKTLLIAGPPGSGRTTALESLMVMARDGGYKIAGGFRINQATTRLSRLSIDDFEDATQRWGAAEGVLFIDDFDEILDKPAERIFEAWANDTCQAQLVLSMTSQSARKYSPLVQQLRARCETVLLLPDPSTDDALLNGPLPLGARALGPGRAATTILNAPIMVQVPVAGR